jgi:3,4-dihydroxy 2-butanone 4-phosphate synthase/GTP cyclohydrolase II
VVPVRVHEPFTVLDLLEVDNGRHAWPLGAALARLHSGPCGVAVLLNCAGQGANLLPQVVPRNDRFNPAAHTRPPTDLRTYGVGAQILKDVGVRRMQLLGSPRRMPSMAGYGLEITGFTAAPGQKDTTS